MSKMLHKLILAGAMAGMAAVAAEAGTASSQFNAQITIQADCTVSSPNALDFGLHGLLSADVDAQMDFTVTCTNSTPYTIALNDGANASGSQNRMANGGEYVNYETYSDAARSNVWDSSNTVSGTGTGAAVTHTVYGRVPAQNTPTPGTYTDTVTITVSY